MRGVLLIGLVLVMIDAPLLCQKNDQVWLFGYEPNVPKEWFGGSVLNFGTEPPYISYFEIPCSFTASASISNEVGELVAYTNGCRIFTAEHELADNGDSINPGEIHETFCDLGYPLSQGVLMLPGEGENYFLVHLSVTSTGPVGALRLTSMTNLNGELRVDEKNMLIDSSNFRDELTAVKHANGRDWWIVVPHKESNSISIYLLNPQEVTKVDDQQIGQEWDHRYWSGQAVFSPNGEKYVRANPFNGIQVFDFDRCNGQLSNAIDINFDSSSISSCGAAFSLDSRFLYVSASSWLFQFDMLAEDIPSSRLVVAEYDGFLSEHSLSTRFFQQMLAPNGRIYITAPNSVRYLHVIQRPEERGDKCLVSQHSLILPTLHAFSVPNFPNFRLGPLDGSPCDTLGLDNHPVSWWRHEVEAEDPQEIRFTDLSYFRPEIWEWDFGDGESGNEQNPIHTYAAPGLYHACLTVSNEYSSDSSCQWIDVMTVSTQESAKDDFSVFPNPFTNFIEIHPSAGYTAITVRILDLHGRVVHAPEVTCPCRLKLDHLPAGVYFYQIEEGTPSQGFGARRGRLLKSGKVVKM